MPVRLRASLFVSAISPLLVLLALKFATVLALLSVLPKTELTVRSEPVMVSVDGSEAFMRSRSPLVLFVALKLVTSLLLFSVVPVFEVVVNRLPLISFVSAEVVSEIAPVVLVSETLPLVLRSPPFKERLRPAVALILPEVLLTLASIKRSLEAPVAAKVMLPAPPLID